MSRPINECLTGLDFGVTLEDNEMVDEAIILARVTRLDTGRASFVMSGNDGLEAVIRAGMISVARQIDEGGWVDVDDEDDE